MDPADAARATELYFRELPRVIFRVCGDWASRTHVAMRKLPGLPGEVRRGIHGKAIRYNGESFAQVWSENEIGLYMERGTGVYGPFKRPIRAKGGAYTDALGRQRKRRMLRWKGTVWGGGSTTTFRASGSGGGVTIRKTKGPGLGVSGSSGYIFAYEVKGMKPRPWFFPTIQARLPLFERSLRATMAQAEQAIRNGGRPFRQVISFG